MPCDDCTRLLLDAALAFFRALGEARPPRHHAVNWAFELAAHPCAFKVWAPDATFVRPDNYIAGELLHTTATFKFRATVVAFD
jgi:hypothetical protein